MVEHFLCKEKFENVIYVCNQFNFFSYSRHTFSYDVYIYMSIKPNNDSYFTYFVFVNHCYITEILIMLRKSPNNRRSIALETSRIERFKR